MPRSVEEELACIPGASTWLEANPAERKRREAILADIRRRVIENGPRRPVESPDRGRLFMPFAALKGYGELVGQAETRVAEGIDRCEPESIDGAGEVLDRWDISFSSS